MIAFLLFSFSLLFSSVFAAPAELINISKRQGYYWQNWSEGSGSWNCQSGNAGAYSVTWNGNNGGFVCGKGWQGGGAR
jgi:endo-1,4-beta-xylanase